MELKQPSGGTPGKGKKTAKKATDQGMDYLDQAVNYSQNRFFSKALNYFDLAEPFFSSPQYLKWLTYLRHERAVVHAEMENYTDAFSSFDLATSGYLELQDYKGSALTMIHRSEVNFKMNDEQKGSYYLRLAEYLVQTYRIDSLNAFLFSALALFYFNAGKYYEASEYYKMAMNKEEEGTYNFAWYQSKLGISYENIFAFDAAEQNLSSAYNHFLRLKCYKELTEVMSRLSKLYAIRGKKEAAKDLEYKMLNLNRHFITQK